MKRQHLHTNWTLLLRGQLPKRAKIQLRAKIELASSFLKHLLDSLALLLVFLPVFVLTLLVAIPNALAGRTLLGGITFLAARRAELGFGPIFRGGFGSTILHLETTPWLPCSWDLQAEQY